MHARSRCIARTTRNLAIVMVGPSGGVREPDSLSDDRALPLKSCVPLERNYRRSLSSVRAYNLVMKRSLLWLLAVVAIGCSNTHAVRGETSQPAITEVEARSIAERKGREGSYDLKRFRLVTIEREREGSFQDSWKVFFEHLPPTPPGGHFTVYVNVVSGEARLIPGR